jgi:hypothetical protein
VVRLISFSLQICTNAIARTSSSTISILSIGMHCLFTLSHLVPLCCAPDNIFRDVEGGGVVVVMDFLTSSLRLVNL